jgi:hypothetical protein
MIAFPLVRLNDFGSVNLMNLVVRLLDLFGLPGAQGPDEEADDEERGRR